MNGWLLILVFALLAAVFWLWATSLRQQTGLPTGNVIYNDTEAWFANDQPLFSTTLHLTGKPDYLVEQQDGTIIPVEVKSGNAPAEPWESHVLQLAAYCALVTETYGIRPPYGIVQYNDQAFAIEYSDELEEDLLDLLAEMRQDLYAGDVHRSHEDWRRCASCGVRGACSQRLG
ncbi:MAG: CRISPR-associated protein Cas4 [Candidatus Promineifilaceae bacterium]